MAVKAKESEESGETNEEEDRPTTAGKLDIMIPV